MAKKNIEGQLDMFNLFDSVEEREENAKGVLDTPVMGRCFSHKEHQGLASIAYLDYHKVYVKLWEQEPVIYQFVSTDEAVDFYVKQLELFRRDKKVKLSKETEALQEAPVKNWIGD